MTMIEKLESTKVTPYDIIFKVNELVDAVNNIIDSALLERAKKAEPEDRFEEERKWIGKLCWYKLSDNDSWKVGVLTKINENTDVFYPFMFNGLWCKICKPVKQDDEAIYKGE